MAKFRYLIIKILEDGKIWEHEVVIRSSGKLEARAKIEMMYPPPEYTCKFIETC